MNLHEIIHTYLRLGPLAGRTFLRTLVRDAGLDVALIEHIVATREEAKS